MKAIAAQSVKWLLSVSVCASVNLKGGGARGFKTRVFTHRSRGRRGKLDGFGSYPTVSTRPKL